MLASLSPVSQIVHVLDLITIRHEGVESNLRAKINAISSVTKPSPDQMCERFWTLPTTAESYAPSTVYAALASLIKSPS